VTVARDYDPDLPEIMLDPDHIGQLLLNLMTEPARSH
jgi:nitrogen-specific signal transduction histidine kinase